MSCIAGEHSNGIKWDITYFAIFFQIQQTGSEKYRWIKLIIIRAEALVSRIYSGLGFKREDGGINFEI